MKFSQRLCLLCLAAVITVVGWSADAQAQYTAPRIFFSDLQSGPNSGGQDNQGVFITLYGKGFGATQGSSTVNIGSAPVYKTLIWSDNRISLQIGNRAASGNIVVNVAGISSNGVPFTVRAGNIYFVSTWGNDGWSGDYANPWRTIGQAKRSMVAGDIVYAMNGVTATSPDKFGASLAITSAGSSGLPMAMVAYPGARVTIGSPSGSTYGIRGMNGSGYWIFAGLTLSGAVEAVDFSNSGNWRLVANDVSCPNGYGTGACINGKKSGDAKLLGNNIHDTGLTTSSDLANYESVAFSGSNNVEVGWNQVGNTRGCRAVLFYTSNAYQSGLSVHDNLIHDVRCDAISFASVDPSAGSVRAFNNVIAQAGTGPTPGGTGGLAPTYACVRVAGSGLGQANVINNTLYDCGAQGGADSGALAASTPATLTDNIIDVSSGQNYVSPNTSTAEFSGSNNLFYGTTSGAPAFFTSSVEKDPQFVNPATLDFHLQSTSPAINACVNTGITRDYDGVPRGPSYDAGAFEYNGASTTTAAGQITENPTTLNFGSIAVGASSTQSVQVSNTGTANATISHVSTTGSGFSVAPVTLPMTLAPGQTTTITVTFAPTTSGTTSGSVVVTSDASDPTSSVQLMGTGTTTAGTLTANATSLNFGTVLVGSGSTQSMTVTAGTATVTISQATITGTGAAAYSISGLTLPATLAAGQSATFQVTFAPTAGGSFSASVTLTSTASNSPTTTSLAGAGQHAVVLSWTASTSTGVVGYNVYRSTTSGGPYTKITATAIAGTSYTDATVASATTYYYVMTAVSSGGVESTYSSQVTAAVPNP